MANGKMALPEMQSKSQQFPIRVAVIGAGAAGLAALRHLQTRPEQFQAVAYEQSSEIGGTWVYTDRVGTDDHGLPIHSSMYKTLVTNIAKEAMVFQDFPFPEHLPSFMKHDKVLKYLQDFAAHFDLRRYIKFHTVVESVRAERSTSEDAVVWEVGVRDVDSSTVNIKTFDAVMVCNGHFSVPMLPNLPGVELFHGPVLHSHEYRDPQHFKGKTVVCLGAGVSGLDISIDLSPHAAKIYLIGTGYVGFKSINVERQWEANMPANIQRIGQRWTDTCKVISTGVVLEGGEEISADAIVICTGYLYTFPFLQGDCKLDVTAGRVTPLWKHMVHVRYPSMFVIGLPKHTNPFPMFDIQAQFAKSLLRNPDLVPSVEQMESDIEKEFQQRLSDGMPVRYSHNMGSRRQWAYLDDLADIGRIPRLPLVVNKLYCYLFELSAKTGLAEFRSIQYRLTGSDTFEVVKKNKP